MDAQRLSGLRYGRVGPYPWIGLIAVAFMCSSMPRIAAAAEPPRLELEKGDHICIIGNTLADRMQHDGWLETYLHSRFPEHDLVIRNLGFSGDELTLRLRSADFGSPDDWLTADQGRRHLRLLRLQRVVRRRGGLAKFKHDLDAFIKHTLGQKYNGQAAPRLVLFSPIAHEDLHDRNLPDGTREQPHGSSSYTAAMAEVATRATASRSSTCSTRRSSSTPRRPSR